MTTPARLGLFVPLTAKEDKSTDVKNFLIQAYALVQDEFEPETLQWLALKYISPLEPSTTTFDTKYLIFDTAAAEAGRQAHLNGSVAAALFANRDALLVKGDDGVAISNVELLANKVVKPAGGSGMTKGLKCGLLVLMTAKAGKVDVVRQRLVGAGANIQGERNPPIWFGFEFTGTNRFGVIGLFVSEADREERLNSPSSVAQEMRANEKEFFDAPPEVIKFDVLAAKI